MKKFILIGMCVVLAAVTFCACTPSNKDNDNNDKNNSNGTTAQTPKTAQECITWLVDKKQETADLTFDFKIPQINIEKPGAQSINEQIKAKFYTEDVKSALNGGFDGVQMFTRTETSLNDNILSIRIKSEIYPSYGTDGEIYTVCYDITTDTLLTPAQVLKNKNYTYEKAMESLRSAFDEQCKEYTEYFDLAGVYLNNEGKAEMVAIALVHAQGADSWKTLFSHTLA